MALGSAEELDVGGGVVFEDAFGLASVEAVKVEKRARRSLHTDDVAVGLCPSQRDPSPIPVEIEQLIGIARIISLKYGLKCWNESI